MKFLTNIFSGFLYWLNGFLGDFGLSIIVFTLLIKIVLLPIDWYSFLQEKKFRKISDRFKEIFKNHKNDPEKQVLLLSELYKEANYNPLLYFLAQTISIPIFLAFFFMLRDLTKELTQISFLGIDLLKPSIFLAILTILLQFFTLQQMPQNQRKFSYFLFGLIALIVLSFPAIFTLYWMTNLILTLLERQIFAFYEKKFVTDSVKKEKADFS